MVVPKSKTRPSSSAKQKLLAKLPTEDEMTRILKRLVKAGDRSAAIMGAAYLEHGLEQVLAAHFRPLTKEEDRRIFDGAAGGVLGTFSAKIRVAYAAKILHENPYHALLLINDIRNTFAIRCTT